MSQKKINYNLLQALKVLLEESHITKASKRLNVTQPTMSATLNKLRETFNDDLLVRVMGEMKLTKKGQQLLNKVSPLVSDVECFFQADQTFNPREYTGEFTVALCDHMSQIALPKITSNMISLGCNARINVRGLTQSDVYEALANGSVDLALGFFSNPPDSLLTQGLFEDEVICLVCTASEIAKKELNMHAFLKAKRIYYAYKLMGEKTEVEMLFKQQGFDAPPDLSSPFLMANILCLIGTEHVLVATEKYYQSIASYLPLTKKRLPVKDMVNIPINQYWHRRNTNHAAKRWFREQVKRIFE